MSDMRTVIADLLMLQPAELVGSAALGETPGWDSFTQLTIMIELERRYGIPVTNETIRAYSNLAAIERLEKEKG